MNSKDLQPKGLGYKIETCDNCGEPVEKIINLLGTERIVPIMCSCKKAKHEAKRIEEENKEKQLRVKSIIKNSLMDEKFKSSRFDSWDFSKGTKKMYNIGFKYASKFSEMKKESIGLLIHGDPGNGKTHTTACIANELIDKMIPVICVNIDGLLNRIKETYNTWGKEGEETILKSLSNADLLIIDDLGTEQDTDWAKTKIYNILDSRYRNGLPIIVTTNISLVELKEKYHKRTYDRLLEMCTPVFNDGKSIRVEKAKEKTQILKELLS
ncbi:DNA replication protein [Clostridium botulinum]